MPDYHFLSHPCRFPNQPAPVNGRAKEGIVRYPQSQPSGGWVEDFNPPGNCTNPDGHYVKRVRAKGLQVEKGKKADLSNDVDQILISVNLSVPLTAGLL